MKPSRLALLLWIAAGGSAGCGGAPRPAPPPPPDRSHEPAVEAPPRPVAESRTEAAPLDDLSSVYGGRKSVVRTISGFALIASPAALDSRDHTALLRLVLPAGELSGRTALAELSARVVVDAAAGGEGEPSLRRAIETLGGRVSVEVGSTSTNVAVLVPAASFRDAARRLGAALARREYSHDQVGLVRERLAAEWTRTLGHRGVETLALRAARMRLLAAPAFLAQLTERDPEEVLAFQRLHWNAAGAACAVWAPGVAAEDTLEVAENALIRWIQGSAKAREPEAPALPPGVVLWAPGPTPCEVGLLLPLPDYGSPHAAARLTLLECLTQGGFGGRLGDTLRAAGLVEPAFDQEAFVDGAARYHLLHATASAEAVLPLWQAVERSRASFVRELPARAQVAAAVARVRLQLLAEDADPARWSEREAQYFARHGKPFELRDLQKQLAQHDTLDLQAAARELAATPVAMLVVGATPPKPTPAGVLLAADSFADTAAAQPGTHDAETQERAAAKHLEAAIRAVGGRELLAGIDGFSGARVGRGEGGAPLVRERVWYAAGDRFRRVRELMRTRIETVVAGNAGEETAGRDHLVLKAEEVESLLGEAARHPLLLLRAAAAGDLRFRLIALRPVEDREMAVLETMAGRERVRMMVDTTSGLVRQVETRAPRAGVGRVHVLERYADYRTTAGFRVPFLVTTTIDETATMTMEWQEFVPGAPRPACLQLGGPER